MDKQTLINLLESLIEHNQEMVEWCEKREVDLQVSSSLQYYTGRVDAYEVVLEAINQENAQ